MVVISVFGDANAALSARRGGIVHAVTDASIAVAQSAENARFSANRWF
jgi:hypothetical protein